MEYERDNLWVYFPNLTLFLRVSILDVSWQRPVSLVEANIFVRKLSFGVVVVADALPLRLLVAHGDQVANQKGGVDLSLLVSRNLLLYNSTEEFGYGQPRTCKFKYSFRSQIVVVIDFLNYV
jgi:hypothetical protein